MSILTDDEREKLLDGHRQVVAADLAKRRAAQRQELVIRIAEQLFVRAMTSWRSATSDVQGLAARCFEHAETFVDVSEQWAAAQQAKSKDQP